MSAANVQLIVDHRGAGNIVGDHAQTVGLIGAWTFSDLAAADEADGGGRFGVDGGGSIGNVNRFLGLGDSQRNVYASITTGAEDKLLLCRRKPLKFHGHAVFAERHGVEMKLSGIGADDGLRPGRVGGTQRYLRPLHRAMLGVVDKAANCSENGGEGS